MLHWFSSQELIAGDLVAAIEHSRHGLDIARTSEHPLVQAIALDAYGSALLLAGYFQEARAHLEEAERIILTLGPDRLLAAQAQIESPLFQYGVRPLDTWRQVNEGLAQIAGLVGDYREAEGRFRRGYELGVAGGDSAAMHGALEGLAFTRHIQGDSAGARRVQERAAALGVDGAPAAQAGDPYHAWAIMDDLTADDPERRATAWDAAERLLETGLDERAPRLAAELHYGRATSLLRQYVETRREALLDGLIREARLAISILEDRPATQTLQLAYALLGTVLEYRAVAEGGDLASSTDLVEAAGLHELAALTAADLGHSQWQATSLGRLAVVERYLGKPASADSAFVRALQAAEEARFLLVREDDVRSQYATTGALGTLYCP